MYPQTQSSAPCVPLHRHRLPLLARLSVWLSLWQQRRALAQLDESRLHDLGLTRAQAQAESARPFWDAPRHWH